MSPISTYNDKDTLTPHTHSQAAFLPYGRRKVRYALIDGQPYFAVDDLFAISRSELPKDVPASWASPHFLPSCFGGEAGGYGVDAVSITGAETIAAHARFPGNRIVTGWIRNQSSRLMLDENGKPQRPAVTLLVDGSLPPEPQRGTADWKAWAQLVANISATAGIN